MAGISISNPVAQGLDGVAFSGERDGVTHSFVVSREALEDVAYEMLETPEALLAAFGQHQQGVADAACLALDAGATGSPAITLASLLS
ncbi:MAG: DUF1488 family protein [Ramlibacter sp.]|nr:DUF1488 family protein [Ramlibacter sp.]